MHAWGAVDLRTYLAQKNHGYSTSAQSYDFCPRLIKLDIPDFTLSHMHYSNQLSATIDRTLKEPYLNMKAFSNIGRVQPVMVKSYSGDTNFSNYLYSESKNLQAK